VAWFSNAFLGLRIPNKNGIGAAAILGSPVRNLQYIVLKNKRKKIMKIYSKNTYEYLNNL
jgi:hypothetical protein